MSWNYGFGSNSSSQGQQMPLFTSGMPQWPPVGFVGPPSYLLTPVPTPSSVNPQLMQNPLNPLPVYLTNNYINQSYLNNIYPASPYDNKLMAGQVNAPIIAMEPVPTPPTVPRSVPPARQKPKGAPEIICIDSSDE